MASGKKYFVNFMSLSRLRFQAIHCFISCNYHNFRTTQSYLIAAQLIHAFNEVADRILSFSNAVKLRSRLIENIQEY